MKLTFLGAAGTVTGSRYLVESRGLRLLVDCGLYQGPRELRRRNWDPLPADPRGLSCVVLTHAHLDHSGYLPRLVADGFHGPVHGTAGTADLCGVILPDAARLQEEEARYAGRKGYSRHKEPRPLFTSRDAEAALDRLVVHDTDRAIDLGHGLTARLRPAGHIVGATSVVLDDGETRVFFSGDVGPGLGTLPADLPEVDVVVTESTYGDRLHGTTDPAELLEEVVRRTVDRGGLVIIPAFAVGRTQKILRLLHGLRQEGRLPDVPVVMDSPMAQRATAVYRRQRDALGLSPGELDAMLAGVRTAATPEESYALDTEPRPMVLLSASGMATGGRVLHHLKHLGTDPRNTILFAGFQAPGTRGADLVAGQREVKIHGRPVTIRAEIAMLDSLSAHFDQAGLLAWLGTAPRTPRAAFVTHGEPGPAATLCQRLGQDLGWPARVAELGETVDLSPG